MGPSAGDATTRSTGSVSGRPADSVEFPLRTIGLLVLIVLILVVAAVAVDVSGVLGG